MVDEISADEMEHRFGFLKAIGATLAERLVGKDYLGGMFGGFRLVCRHHEMDVRIEYSNREFVIRVSLPDRNEWIDVGLLGSPGSGWPDRLCADREFAEFIANFLRENWAELVRRLRVFKPGFVPPPV